MAGGRQRSLAWVLGGLFWVGLFFGGAASANASPELRVVQHQMMMLPVEDSLTLIHVVELENRGDEASRELFMPLLPGNSQLSLLEGWQKAKVTPQGIADSRPLEPGEQVTLSYSYQLPWRQERIVLPFEVSYLTETMRVLIPPAKLALEGEDFLTQSEAIRYEGEYLRRFTRLNLHPGETWRLAVQPAMSGEGAVGNKAEHASGLPVVYHDYGTGVQKAVFNLFFIAVVLLCGFFGVRGSLWRAQLQVRRQAVEGYAQERERLLANLVRLEADYRGGRISQDEYQQRREEEIEAMLPYESLLQGEGERGWRA